MNLLIFYVKKFINMSHRWVGPFSPIKAFDYFYMNNLIFIGEMFYILNFCFSEYFGRDPNHIPQDIQSGMLDLDFCILQTLTRCYLEKI